MKWVRHAEIVHIGYPAGGKTLFATVRTGTQCLISQALTHRGFGANRPAIDLPHPSGIHSSLRHRTPPPTFYYLPVLVGLK